jgi:hypothetical protein
MNDYIINNAHFLKRARNIRNELLNKTDRFKYNLLNKYYKNINISIILI